MYGNLEVTLLDTEFFSDYSIRTLKVQQVRDFDFALWAEPFVIYTKDLHSREVVQTWSHAYVEDYEQVLIIVVAVVVGFFFFFFFFCVG